MKGVRGKQLPAAVVAVMFTASGVCGEALEEVVVTATRRTDSLQQVPLSLTALTGDDLRAFGGRDIGDLADRIPGLAFTDDGFGGYRIMIRGIASGTFIETRPLTALYFDETPVMALASGSAGNPQWGGARPEFADLARIEVLRGPQGVLYGAGALGGAVRLIPNAPDLQRTDAYIAGSYSGTAHGGESRELEGMLNLPLAKERAAARLVGYLRDDAGFIDNLARSADNSNSAETIGGRLSLLWRATPQLLLTLRAQRQVRRTDGINGADVGFGAYEQFRPSAERDDDAWNLFTLTAQYTLPRAEIVSITSYFDRQPSFAADISRYAGLFLEVPVATANDFDDGMRDFIQEIRLVSSAGERITALLGAYYEDQTRSLDQYWISPGFDALTGGLAASFGYPDRPFYAKTSGTMQHRAVYGDVAFAASQAWRASLGARWFEFDQSMENINDGLIMGTRTTVRASSDERGVTPRLALEYRPRPVFMGYVSATKGYRPGGTNEFTDQQATHCAPELAALGFDTPPRGFQSDKLWNFELGVKSRWLDGRLIANVSVYRVDWTEMQTFRVITCAAPDDMGFVDNAGKAVTEGLELEVAWHPTDDLELRLATAYVDARLTADAPNIAGEKGERIPTVPDWSVSASVSQEFHLTGQLDGFARADYRYTAGSWSDFDELVRRQQPARQLADLALGLQARRWRVEIFAENIFDERGVLVHANNLIGEWQILVRPRTVGVRASLGL